MGGLAGDKLDSGPKIGMAGEGRQKSPPLQGKFIIAHVEGESAAHNSSVTSSVPAGDKPGGEGRDEEPTVAFCFECDWTMNSWVFRQYRSCLQSQSIMHFATLTVTEHTGHIMHDDAPICGAIEPISIRV